MNNKQQHNYTQQPKQQAARSSLGTGKNSHQQPAAIHNDADLEQILYGHWLAHRDSVEPCTMASLTFHQATDSLTLPLHNPRAADPAASLTTETLCVESLHALLQNHQW